MFWTSKFYERKRISPLRLTVAVVAKCALHDGIQRHEAYLFEQFKRFISVCIVFPLVLQTEGDLMLHIFGIDLDSLFLFFHRTYQHGFCRIRHQFYIWFQNIIMETWGQEPPMPEPPRTI